MYNNFILSEKHAYIILTFLGWNYWPTLLRNMQCERSGKESRKKTTSFSSYLIL